jgi:predicted transcriptional regulator
MSLNLTWQRVFLCQSGSIHVPRITVCASQELVMSRLSAISQRFANASNRMQALALRLNNVCTRFNAEYGDALGEEDLLMLENCLAAIEAEAAAIEESATELEQRASALQR